MKYALIMGQPTEFFEQVNEHLRKGYRLQGDLMKFDRYFVREMILIEPKHEGVSNEQIAEMFTCVIHKLTKMEEKMVDDFTALEKAQADNATAIDNAVVEIKDLFAQIAATPPSNQPEIDRLTTLFNAKTEALAAVAKAPTA